MDVGVGWVTGYAGVAAALNSWGKTRQQAMALKSRLSMTDSLGSFSDTLGSFSKWADGVTGELCDSLAPRLAEYADYMGASAGVFSLAAVDLCVTVERIIAWLSGRRTAEVGTLQLFVGAMNVQQTACVVWRELQHLHKGQVVPHLHAGVHSTHWHKRPLVDVHAALAGAV